MNTPIWSRLTMVLCWWAWVSAVDVSEAARVLGIDVSKYQQTIAWPSVASAGVAFAWAKATEGVGYEDAYFAGNQVNGKAAGVLMGSYHYARYDLNTGTAGAVAEADYFWDRVRSHTMGDGKCLMPMLDVEASTSGYDPNTLAQWINQWCQTVVNHAASDGIVVKPVIYVSACHANYFDSSVARWTPWIANYNGQDPQTGTPWSVCGGYNMWGTWVLWQYTSSGSIAGISGNVDHDVFNGTLADLIQTLVIAGDSPFTNVVSIAKSADDAEESSQGVVNLTSSDLELVRDDGTGAGNQVVGLRFHVGVPAGAIVTSAHIQLAADEVNAEPTVLQIGVEAADYASRFDSNNLSGRALLGTTVRWQPSPWLTVGEAGPAQRTPDLTALVQPMVSRPGWAKDNAMAFVIRGDGHRTADAFDKTGGTPPKLTVTYRMRAPLLTTTVSLAGSEKDAEQFDNGKMTFTSSDLELVRDEDQGAGNQTVGLRFENLPLPAGACITEANIQFTADETSSEPTTLAIRAHRSGNATAFGTNAFDLTSRPVTLNSVVWTPPPWNTLGERGVAQRTPDLAALVAEVVARPSWTPGNPLVFLISGSGKRVAESYDKSGGTPAALTVSYYAKPVAGSFAAAMAAAGISNTNGPAAGPLADFDGDGLNNFLEHALGLDPGHADKAHFGLSLQDGVVTYTYRRPRVVSDAAYAVEWSDNLNPGSWNATGVTEQVVADDGASQAIQATLFAGQNSRCFVRLKVTTR